MYCGQCGNDLKDGASFCGNCGFPIKAPPTNPVYQLPRLNFQTAIKLCFNNYFNFKGRSRRSEYWWFVLFIFAIDLLIVFFPFSIHIMEEVWFIAAIIFSLTTIIPQTSVTTRRLHDIGYSGWWQLLFVPLISAIFLVFVGTIILSFFLLTEGIGSSEIGLFAASFIWLTLSTGLLITWIFWLTKPGNTGPNKYGTDPRQIYETTDQSSH